MNRTRSRGALALVLALAGRALAAPCAGEAIVTIVGDNRSADGSVELTVSGTRLDAGGACHAAASGLATSYAEAVVCSGPGPTTCGRIGGLAPGRWVHRVSAQVTGSALQRQAQQTVVLARTTPVSNLVEWTLFGRTFVVTNASGANVRSKLDAALAYTAGAPYPALVRFDPTTFPGADAPVTVPMQNSCALDTCATDQRETAYCFDGADVTVDALDDDGRPGGVVLTVGLCNNSLLRLYGTDNVLRGLVLQGSADPMPAVAVDTVAIAGIASSGNRLEACTIVGPSKGDAVSVEGDANAPGGGPAGVATLVGSEIRGAEDKGVKIGYGGVAHLERSCVHDNANGGVQATLGGTVTAVENVVQHNRGGPAENGLLVGVPNEEDSQYPNALTTRGNVVRFNGARGISVVNNATATLEADVVAENYRAGLRIVRALAGVETAATVRGSTFACNYAPGICLNTGETCREDAECSLQLCGLGSAAVKGVGVAVDMDCPLCAIDLDLGLGGTDVGRNALTLNANPNALAPDDGVNASSILVAPADVPAAGNQWEHCDVPDPDPVNPNKCNMTQVATYDVRIGPGATPWALGTPIGPRHGPNPVVTAISPPRPRAGDLVRVYGGSFNAIDGVACHPAGLPADPCSAANPAIVAANAADPSQGNQVTVTIGGVAYPADVHQVTPSMLVFEMPVDCDQAGELAVARGNDPAPPVVLCDPAGCTGRPVGALCDDDDACTVGETCQVSGTCSGGGVVLCGGDCMTGVCDPFDGCVVRSAGAPCDDGNACTVGDGCSGTNEACLPGPAPSCAGACLTGACDPPSGCVPAAASTACSDDDACTTDDHCSGAADECVGSAVDCGDGNACTTDGCDPATGCAPVVAPDGTPCGGDACHGPSSCQAGTCEPGVAISCDDGHACTADTCDAVHGCRYDLVTGVAAVSCRVVELRRILATFSSERERLAAALGRRLDVVERRTARGDAATGRAREGRRARRAVDRFRVRVREARSLDAPTRGALQIEADALRTAVVDFFDL